jgi:ferredoxin/menaquinone-dependent protoporphyrinogen IX oxidase
LKIVIFYFSGTGNTWWASTELKKELEHLNNSVEMYSLENPDLLKEGLTAQKIEEAEHIIIGYPVYGSDMPKNMRTFVHKLPKVVNSKKFSSFCTQAGFSGDANIYYKKEITAKGYVFRQSIQINLTTNFNVDMLPFSLSKPAKGKKLEKKKKKASKKIKFFAKRVYKNEEQIEGKKVYLKLLGHLQRHFFNKNEDKFSKYFKFFKDRCISCNLCIKNCPTENWYFDESNNLKSHGKCILCFRCYNFCPKHAITFGKNVKNPDKCVRFKLDHQVF